jgi:hypothetical protein
MINLPKTRYLFIAVLIVGIIGFWSFQIFFPQTNNEFNEYVRGLPDGNIRHWAIIVGASPEDRHVAWPFAFHNTIHDYYGYEKQWMFLHTANSSFVYGGKLYLIQRDAPSTKEYILRSIRIIAELADRDDDVLFWWSGHGLPNGLETPDGILSASILDSELDKIQCKYLYIILGSCYSGSMIDDLMADNRIIYTASNKTETAKASKFRSDFMWASYAALEPFPFFGKKNECAAAADLNFDGKISLLELFNFAEKFILAKRSTQHPQKWIGSLIGNDSNHFLGRGSYLYKS